MKILDSTATRDALPFPDLIDALRAMFVAGCHVPLRHNHPIAAEGGGGTVLIMPAWQDGGYLGIKTVNVFPGNAALGLPGLHSTYVLYDGRTGAPLAQLDGNEITSRRTAAASALAASYLARPDATRMTLLGAGRVGSLVPEAYRAVLPIRDVDVWDAAPAASARLVAHLNALGFAARAVDDLPASVARADVVTCATLATEPVVQGAWLAPGSHLDLIGSFTPAMREADDACFAQASVFVDTREAFQKSGDLLGPLERQVIGHPEQWPTLETLCRGQARGRANADERTVFKAVGTALEDLAAASLVYARHAPAA
ncbi:ornithine cyclodeaminase family protein [Burkholderia sp. Ac-20379]|uniref:ornithine cyclodeaminase family protein n=1 Tax=Burkholderia sp. Ac-20379 TaxID=2703900 RepID=UPI00197D74C9|nr:ornithine cyclodeaminase family protein [Burkholderia sp. Ac-20379]MBN3727419.1 ornithine cyclodeaminase family protein [Burkholderia sp. Ac-20379]